MMKLDPASCLTKCLTSAARELRSARRERGQVLLESHRGPTQPFPQVLNPLNPFTWVHPNLNIFEQFHIHERHECCHRSPIMADKKPDLPLEYRSAMVERTFRQFCERCREAQRTSIKELPAHLSAPENIDRIRQDLRNLILTASPQMAKRYLGILIEDIVLDGKKVTIRVKNEAILGFLEQEGQLNTGGVASVLNSVYKWRPQRCRLKYFSRVFIFSRKTNNHNILRFNPIQIGEWLAELSELGYAVDSSDWISPLLQVPGMRDLIREGIFSGQLLLLACLSAFCRFGYAIST